MNIQLDQCEARYQIKHYTPGQITINDEIYTQSVILTPHHLFCISPRTLSELVYVHFHPLEKQIEKEDTPNIILLGTGSTLIIPPEELLQPFFLRGQGIEFMTSQAACYTFTVLSAEQRKVAACILVD